MLHEPRFVVRGQSRPVLGSQIDRLDPPTDFAVDPVIRIELTEQRLELVERGFGLAEPRADVRRRHPKGELLPAVFHRLSQLVEARQRGVKRFFFEQCRRDLFLHAFIVRELLFDWPCNTSVWPK